MFICDVQDVMSSAGHDLYLWYVDCMMSYLLADGSLLYKHKAVSPHPVTFPAYIFFLQNSFSFLSHKLQPKITQITFSFNYQHVILLLL